MTVFRPPDSYIAGLYFIAGDMVDDGEILSDVFHNANGGTCVCAPTCILDHAITRIKSDACDSPSHTTPHPNS